VGSSYGIVDRVFDRNSSLLGLFMPMEVGIISYEDVLSQVGDPLLSALLRGSVHRHVASEPHRFGASQPQRSRALTASRSPGRGTVLPNLNNAYSTNATKNPAEIAIQPPQPHEINLASTLKNIGGRSLRG